MGGQFPKTNHFCTTKTAATGKKYGVLSAIQVMFLTLKKQLHKLLPTELENNNAQQKRQEKNFIPQKNFPPHPPVKT